jgi:hypothetical protein
MKEYITRSKIIDIDVLSPVITPSMTSKIISEGIMIIEIRKYLGIRLLLLSSISK